MKTNIVSLSLGIFCSNLMTIPVSKLYFSLKGINIPFFYFPFEIVISIVAIFIILALIFYSTQNKK
jgi:hypothetical protein